MKVIFLDIDGVLNSVDFLPEELALGWDGWKANIDPARVAKLNDLVMASDATVVLSSTWRFHFPAATMTRMLRECGASFDLHSVTPTHTKGRVDGIYAWIHLHGEPKAWVCIDDDPNCMECGDHWVRTVDGLEDEHVAEALAKLGSIA